MSTTRRESGALADLTAHASAPERGSERGFGIVFAILFLAIGAWPMMRGASPQLWAFAVAAIFLLTALAAPKWLAPLNRLWMAFGLLLAKIVSPIMLFVVYVIAVVPTGILMRLRGKDPLRRRFEPEAASYWVHRNPPGKPDETMGRQF